MEGSKIVVEVFHRHMDVSQDDSNDWTKSSDATNKTENAKLTWSAQNQNAQVSWTMETCQYLLSSHFGHVGNSLALWGHHVLVNAAQRLKQKLKCCHDYWLWHFSFLPLSHPTTRIASTPILVFCTALTDGTGIRICTSVMSLYHLSPAYFNKWILHWIGWVFFWNTRHHLGRHTRTPFWFTHCVYEAVLSTSSGSRLKSSGPKIHLCPHFSLSFLVGKEEPLRSWRYA